MAATIRQYRSGQSLFKEGESSRSMFLIKKGSVSVRKMKGSAFVEIARIYSNEVIGELSFFDRQPRSATAVATSDVEALEIDFVSLDKVYKNVPDYIKSIMNCVAERLRKANDTIRRLQKNVVLDEEAPKQAQSTEPDAAAILAATQDIDIPDVLKKSNKPSGGDSSG
jgi:CRP/FNR family cyclic AMP-dependent transcriptional regulator